MINFQKRIKKSKKPKELHPVKIYDTLDRASDKGPLRPSQLEVLNKWNDTYKSLGDCVIKLHTGQGKTIIGLLILQSKLNEVNEPSLYICPNIYLVKQTCAQAKQFGVEYCVIEPDGNIPDDFINAKKILITHTQKVFNGLTKFGFKGKAIPVGTIVLDDSHSCIDSIEDSFTIKIKSETPVYDKIFALFEANLEDQGYAKLQEVKEGSSENVISVPYWVWNERYTDVTEILVSHKNDLDQNGSNMYYYFFPWRLIKDQIENCYCTFTGSSLEIKPYHNPIEKYGSFFNAKHRVFMSATTNNDSFFIKGLSLAKETIENPLVYNDKLWSGEKMILSPYKIDSDLSRFGIVNFFAPSDEKRKYGIVVLTSGFKKSNYWEELGSIKINTHNIFDEIGKLKNGNYENTLVIANRYDGIDLPDNSCRVLIIDSKPYAENLYERYQEDVRMDSDLIDIKIAQKIEQGLGRGVRGEKDYCVIILTGNDIIRVISDPRYKRFFSEETKKQIDIGTQVTKFAVEDADSADSLKVLQKVIDQCLERNDGWKEYYKSEMNEIKPRIKVDNILDILEKERRAEEKYSQGEYEEAVKEIQFILDNYIDPSNRTERGWYLQQMARFKYNISVSKSNKFQIQAHKNNKYLYKPSQGMDFKRLEIHENRVQKIIEWIKKYENYEELSISLNTILNDISFGVKADTFEHALEQLGKILGFNSERPEKYWKEGPDNLWCIEHGKYILFECKNDVKENRAEIYKKETGQMNNSQVWFRRKYEESECLSVMIINTRMVSNDASLDPETVVMRKSKLKFLKKNIEKFFKEFINSNLESIDHTNVSILLEQHKLSNKHLFEEYYQKVLHKN
ncbi:DEAD/DEAH box helicase family protein [uncultured Kordia sp.]|uniref:DEAD/DEAH box helicase n=1 Tax=uncultured Kordia sp. TaxID=507699 RepID=UPI0026073216|nr:DEAD/DEAH box helicase family protein [uncultured Kordia sp.]